MCKMNISRLFYCIFFLVIPFCLLGQDLPTQFLKITNTEGLTSNTVHAIHKDRMGFIWLGTSSGLNRFDGIEIKTYKEFEAEYISYITDLDDQTLLVGMEPGLKSFNKRTGETVNIKLDSKPTIVRDIYVIDKNRFLVATEQGLYQVSEIDQNRSIKKINLDNKASLTNATTSILAESATVFWITTQNGLCRYDMGSNKISVYNNPASNYLTSLVSVDPDNIYVGSYKNGLFVFSKRTKEFSPVSFSKDIYIKCLSKDELGNLYIGTDSKGLKIWNPKTNVLKSIDYSPQRDYGINSSTILSLYIDNSIIWIGTNTGGVNYNPADNKIFNIYSSLVFNSINTNVRSFLIYDQDKKLIGTRSGLIYVSEKENIVKEFSSDKKSSILRSGIITQIYQYRDKVLVGTYGGGIYIFNPQSLTLSNFSEDHVFLHGGISRMTTDLSGNLWIATDEGLYCYDKDLNYKKSYTVTNSGIANNTIINIGCDSNNCLWIATLNSGVSLLDINSGIIKSNIFPKEYDLILNKVYCIYEDSKKNIWICTNKGLLQIGQSFSTIKRYSIDNILPDNTVKGVIEDDLGNLWIATLKGAVRLDLKKGTHHVYDASNGLTSYNFNNIVQKDHNGNIWWSNDDGLFFSNLSFGQKKKNIKSLVPVITSIDANDENVSLKISPEYQKQISLESRQNNIRLKFSLLSYSNPKSIIYEYMLEGYDNKWHKVNKNEISYFNLPSGSYRFLLRNPEHPEAETQLMIKINKSYIFIIYYILIIGVIAGAFFILRTKKKKGLPIMYTPNKDRDVDLKLTQSELENIQEKLLSYIDKHKPYLRNNLKIADLATEIDVSVVDLSNVLNTYMKVSFADFINAYRVNEFIMYLNGRNVQKYTMTALSEHCGFNSRTTFYRAFKKRMGKGPLEYAKEFGINFKKE